VTPPHVTWLDAKGETVRAVGWNMQLTEVAIADVDGSFALYSIGTESWRFDTYGLVYATTDCTGMLCGHHSLAPFREVRLVRPRFVGRCALISASRRVTC
jgi:hypothetical protein